MNTKKQFSFPIATQALALCFWACAGSVLLGGELTIATQFTYNENGALETRTAADGVVTTFVYDDADRLTGQQYSNGVGNVSLNYRDDNLLNHVTDGTGTTSFQYHPVFKSMTKATYPGGRVINYAYDGNGAMAGQQVQGELGETYSYDQQGRIQQIHTLYGTTTLTYNPSTGQLASRQMGNGILVEYGYYPDTGRVHTIRQTRSGGELIAEFTRDYYPNGLLKTVTEESSAGTKTITYIYDDLLRLQSAHYAPENKTESYEYDANGNRTRKLIVQDGQTLEDTRYRYNGLNQIIQGGNEVFFHDTKGNIKKRISPGGKETEYFWDNENRLVKVQFFTAGSLTKTIDYTYRGSGERVKKVVTEGASVKTINYVNSQGSVYQPLAIYTSGGPTQIFFSGSSAYMEGGILRYYLDGIGGTARITGQSGAVVESYAYDSFGNITNQPAGVANSLYYNGEQFEADTGLIFLRNRYYDPKLGRFLSLDAHPGVAYRPQTLNPYIYCHNDPINYSDPLGLCDELTAFQARFLDGLWDTGIYGLSAGLSLGEFILEDVGGARFGPEANFLDGANNYLRTFASPYEQWGFYSKGDTIDQYVTGLELGLGVLTIGKGATMAWQHGPQLWSSTKNFLGFYDDLGSVNLGTFSASNTNSLGQIFSPNVVKTGDVMVYSDFAIGTEKGLIGYGASGAGEITGPMRQLVKYSQEQGAGRVTLTGTYTTEQGAALGGGKVGETFNFTFDASEEGLRDLIKQLR